MIDLDSVHPFAPRQFRGSRAEASAAFWEWYRRIGSGNTGSEFGNGPPSDDELDQVRHLQIPSRLSGTGVELVLNHCRTFSIPGKHVVDQMKAAELIRERVSFAKWGDVDILLTLWPLAHGRMVAALAGLNRTWQYGAIDDLSRAHFLAGQLVRLKKFEAGEILWIPKDDYVTSGVDLADFDKGVVTEALKRVIWKQLVRIRDRIARTTSLYEDLPKRHRRPYRRWWMTISWSLDEIERRDYDIWKAPIEPGAIDGIAIFLQSWFARGAFRGK